MAKVQLPVNKILIRVRKLCDAAGFDPAVVVENHLEAAVRRRLRLTGLSVADYRDHLQHDSAEHGEVLEELLVRESWFFRDLAPFELLGELAQTRWRDRSAPLRVLSAPCAGGEEPYSIAMALMGGGLPLASLHIDAFDLSRRALVQAAAGEYGARAVRLIPPALLAGWLEVAPEGQFRVQQALRNAVRLHQGNLLELSGHFGPEKYDVVFSRNALIYLNAPARARVLDHLAGLLKPDGLLFLGHAETGLLRGRSFSACDYPSAFVFQRASPKGPTPRATPVPRARSVVLVPRPSTQNPVTVALPPSVKPVDDCAPVLAQARALADRGVYAAAADLLTTLLVQQPERVDVQHLMGLVRGGQGNTLEARRCFERALYLDPRHRPSLEHLALLLAASGEDAEIVRLLQRRAERSDLPQ